MAQSEEEKVIFDVTNDADTIIDALEGEAVIEYKYEDEEVYEEVYEEDFSKGKVKTDDGEFPPPEEGKVIEKIRVKITPSNYPFYKSRTATYEGADKDAFKEKGKFELQPMFKRDFEFRAQVSKDLTDAKIASLVKKEG